MTDLRTAAQQALEALEALQGGCTDHDDGTVEAITVWCPEIITALKAALAEPVQEPVAWMDPHSGEVCRAHWLEYHAPERDVDRFSCPLYTTPPRRDALLEALKLARPYISTYTLDGYHAEVKADAAIKAMEEGK